ncbi:hypothetical protein LWI28_028284 [Acer negundo]|uniref:Uncharacterized protein n=1 Tax=Acer negundo TaxID=4023 RepID=A0AAD5IWU3_ACENE|nr:hypothetical protein LWI28_028284 [Acer negundo]KAK4845363.1 hypothetical protein QYF36_004124 [Acer negundo]
MVPNSPHSQVTISIESLASSFESMLFGDLSMSSRVCIFRIPKILHRHNPQAYEPNAFSIGPFRCDDDNLKPTQKIKMKYLQGLLRRATNSKELLRKLTGAVTAIEKEARECYAGPIGNSSVEEFAKILVLDGCFIIELFRKDAEEVNKDPDDPIFSMSCLLEFLKHDLILLENQIPWPVLERLFNMTMVPGGKTLIELALGFFSNMFSSHNKPTIETDLIAEHEIKHILDLLRLSLILPLDQPNIGTGWQPFPCARKIKGSGIKFKKVAPDTILDIRFSNGCLEIPPLLVQETTETVFRNLISLEQCLPDCPPIITSYAKLMDNLIDTPEDVEILSDHDVLDNWLNPEDATQFFNKLYNDAYVKTFYYHDVCQQVNSYSKRWWPKWRYFYTHNYFTAPWAIVSQIVAVIFLIIGFLQTYYSIVGYLGDKKKGA